MSIETVAETAQADVSAVASDAGAVATEVKTEAAAALSLLITNRVADVAVGLVILAAVWLGHVL